MKPLSIKTEVRIYFILIIIILLLTFKVYYDSQKYNCEECVINFKHKMNDPVGIQKESEKNATIIELYEYFIKDKCLIFWDKANGYMKNG